MAFCQNCGKELHPDSKFCDNCGAPVNGQQQKQSFGDVFNDFNNTADTTNSFSAQDISENKIMAVLSYFNILVLIPIFAAKNSPYARYHANQGLILMIAEGIYSVALGMIKSIFGGGIVTTVFSLVNILFFVLFVIGIVNSASGKAKELPLIGKFRILK